MVLCHWRLKEHISIKPSTIIWTSQSVICHIKHGQFICQRILSIILDILYTESRATSHTLEHGKIIYIYYVPIQRAKTQGTPAGRTTGKLPRAACTLVPIAGQKKARLRYGISPETRTPALANVAIHINNTSGQLQKKTKKKNKGGKSVGGKFNCYPSWLSNANGRVKGQIRLVLLNGPMTGAVTKHMVRFGN